MIYYCKMRFSVSKQGDYCEFELSTISTNLIRATIEFEAIARGYMLGSGFAALIQSVYTTLSSNNVRVYNLETEYDRAELRRTIAAHLQDE